MHDPIPGLDPVRRFDGDRAFAGFNFGSKLAPSFAVRVTVDVGSGVAAVSRNGLLVGRKYSGVAARGGVDVEVETNLVLSKRRRLG